MPFIIGADREVEMATVGISLNRRMLIKAGLAVGASQVIGAPFINRSLAEEPVKIGNG
jgi:branched-chain amino acid transport system substrate-binding protein